MEIPYISSEYKILFKPEVYGNYVNDHCIVKYNDDYHLFGITSFTATPPDERYFVHGVGKSLDEPFREVGKSIDRGTLAWSPCIIPHNGDYYMFYGPSPTSLSISPDMFEWFNYPVTIKNEPIMAMHRDHFVIKADNGEYLMYVSGVKDRRGCISVASSNDLLNWQFRGYALTADESSPLKPAWGAMESPFVVSRNGWYYLFVTYTDCSQRTYNNTLVFASQDPLNFGCYMGSSDEAKPITELYAHAPEVIEENGKYHITTSGWLKSPTPNAGCVSIADLEWKKA